MLGDHTRVVGIIDGFLRARAQIFNFKSELAKKRLEPFLLRVAGMVAGERNSHGEPASKHMTMGGLQESDGTSRFGEHATMTRALWHSLGFADGAAARPLGRALLSPYWSPPYSRATAPAHHEF